MAEDQSREHDEQRKVQRAEPSTAGPEGLLAPDIVSAYPTSLLSDPRLKGRGNGPVRNTLMLQMQRTYGNKAVQRFLQRAATTPSVPRVTSMNGEVQRFLQRTKDTAAAGGLPIGDASGGSEQMAERGGRNVLIPDASVQPQIGSNIGGLKPGAESDESEEGIGGNTFGEMVGDV